MGNKQHHDCKSDVQISSIPEEQLVEFQKKWKVKFPDGLATKSEFIKELSQIRQSNLFWETVFALFDTEKTGTISFNQFVTGFSEINLNEHGLDKKLELIFKLYDIDSNGKLEDSELDVLVEIIHSSQNCPNFSLATENVSLTEVVEKLKIGSKDGTLLIEEFVKMVKESNELCHRIERLSITENWLERMVEVQTKEADSFKNQAAGHTGSKGLLQEDGFVLKHYTHPEFQAYEKFQLPINKSMHHLIPQYGGRVMRTNPCNGENDHYLKLENLTHNMKKPCVLDCKIGTSSYEDDSPLTKKIFQGTADLLSTTSELGFRICGLKCYQRDTDTFVTKDKKWGVNLTAATMTPFLKTFVQNGDTIRYDVISAIIPELEKIASWFQVQTSYKFYGSSILFVYDGANLEKAHVVVRMVDFAHVVETTDGTKDMSYLTGISNILQSMNTLKQEGEEAEKIDKKHEFQKFYITGSSLCYLCSKYIWITQGHGVRCIDCGISAHAECQPFFPNNCLRVEKEPLLPSLKQVVDAPINFFTQLSKRSRGDTTPVMTPRASNSEESSGESQSKLNVGRRSIDCKVKEENEKKSFTPEDKKEIIVEDIITPRREKEKLERIRSDKCRHNTDDKEKRDEISKERKEDVITPRNRDKLERVKSDRRNKSEEPRKSEDKELRKDSLEEKRSGRSERREINNSDPQKEKNRDSSDEKSKGDKKKNNNESVDEINIKKSGEVENHSRKRDNQQDQNERIEIKIEGSSKDRERLDKPRTDKRNKSEDREKKREYLDENRHEKRKSERRSKSEKKEINSSDHKTEKHRESLDENRHETRHEKIKCERKKYDTADSFFNKKSEEIEIHQPITTKVTTVTTVTTEEVKKGD